MKKYEGTMKEYEGNMNKHDRVSTEAKCES